MWPLLRPGAYLLIEPITAPQLALGDVLVFRQQERLLVHRLIRRKLSVSGKGIEYLLTKGDSCRLPDAPITAAQVVGRVAALLHGRRNMRLSSPLRIAQRRLIWGISVTGPWGYYIRWFCGMTLGLVRRIKWLRTRSIS